ncbi:saccharopine dehydrogenase-like oxidoreductase [Anopheles nili]|uniref:saccharopine dehydrogenase-like oxidoreductase n=1 Tax=Anopheles nili TaxID=185578 RepID=UPI00237B089C|nr:saccharopine dehydrogenase-like oxidoreductase [Anopheles nili]
MNQKEKKLDIVIFGASGFTGKYTIFEGIKLLNGLRWGIAGRSQKKLQETLMEIGKKANKDLSDIPIVTADLKDTESLKQLAEQCKVLINCCGPYRFYGEPVVRACIEAGTHHVDVSGEPQYMERMQLEYHQQAQERGVYVVSACGFDSIPADLGTVFLEREFDGVVNSVETYLQMTSKIPYDGGAVLHYGTWESAIYGLAHANELRPLRSKLYKSRLPNFQPRLKNQMPMHKTNILNGWWAVPFPGSDRSVVMRSQRYFYDAEHKRPIQMKAYVAFASLLQVLGVAFVATVFAILCRFEIGRKLLLQHPKLFSFGFCSHDGPSERLMENTEFTMYFRGLGWDKTEKLLDANDQYKSSPKKKIITRVSGTNPGYGATCVALILAAVTILRESDKMPGSGGVYPPGAAYAKTSLIEQLCENGLKFEVLRAAK